jgi:Fe-S cluster biosynthesis and repair protein YggX
MAAELLAHACPGCFRDWMNTEVMIINEYRLDLSLPRNQELLDLEMAKFLNLPSAAHAGPQGEGSG